MMPGLSDSALPSNRICERLFQSSIWQTTANTVAKSEHMPARIDQSVARDIHFRKPSCRASGRAA